MLSEAGKKIVQHVWLVSRIVLVALSHGPRESLLVQEHIGIHVAGLQMVILSPKVVSDTLIEKLRGNLALARIALLGR